MRYTALLFLFAPVAFAQPAINPIGITNAAGPFCGIAPGSIVQISGTGLGAPNAAPINLFQNTTYPLPTSGGLNGTTVTFVPMGGQGPEVLNQGTIYGIMLYESPTTLDVILPSPTIPANYNAYVTYNGQTSAASEIIRVMTFGFGLFTIMESQGGPASGFGPGLLLEQNPAGTYVFGSLNNSARPGGSIFLFGTGLGAVEGNESQGPATSGVVTLSPAGFQVYIGGQPATVSSQDFVGRFVDGSVSFAGVDVIQVQVPPNVQGCYVPVTVVTNNTSSNFVTISVDPSGGMCSEPVVGYSAADLQQMASDQMARVGTAAVVGGTLTGIAADGSQYTVRNDSVTTSFLNLSAVDLNATEGYPSMGGCQVLPVQSGVTPVVPAAFVGTPMDAGATIGLAGPDGSQTITQTAGQITYGALNSNTTPLIDPGAYTLIGGGGADVGAFQGTFNVPGFPQVVSVSGSGTDSIDTTQNLVLQWTGGDPNSEIIIVGLGVDLNSGYTAIMQCTAPPAAQQFVIPNWVLNWMPTTSTSVGFLAVQNLGQMRFQAPGLEVGYFIYEVGPTIAVQFTGGVAVKE